MTEPQTYDSDKVKAGRYESENHALSAEYSPKDGDGIRIVNDSGEFFMEIAETEGHLFPNQIKAHAVGFWNQLQTERKKRGLGPYHTEEEPSKEAIDALNSAKENYEMA